MAGPALHWAAAAGGLLPIFYWAARRVAGRCPRPAHVMDGAFSEPLRERWAAQFWQNRGCLPSVSPFIGEALVSADRPRG